MAAEEARADVQLVRNILDGGAANRGDLVHFRLEFEDRTKTLFAAPFEIMARMIQKLQTFAYMADQVRAGVPADQVTVASPYIIQRVSNSGRSSDGQYVVMMFQTAEGIPLEVAMTPAHAVETIERLEMEMTKLKKPQPGKH